MNTRQASFQPLVSRGARLAAALAVAGFVAAAWTGTERESGRAVQAASAAIAAPLHVTLPAVEIVGQRTRAEAVAATGTARPAL
jgi:hypothetical protein